MKTRLAPRLIVTLAALVLSLSTFACSAGGDPQPEAKRASTQHLDGEGDDNTGESENNNEGNYENEANYENKNEGNYENNEGNYENEGNEGNEDKGEQAEPGATPAGSAYWTCFKNATDRGVNPSRCEELL